MLYRVNYLEHSAKGSHWAKKDHAYIDKIPVGNGQFKYIYTQAEADALKKEEEDRKNGKTPVGKILKVLDKIGNAKVPTWLGGKQAENIIKKYVDSVKDSVKKISESYRPDFRTGAEALMANSTLAQRNYGFIERPHSIQDDMRAANPNYYGRGNPEYSRNCDNVAMTYELRRRGYNVTAMNRGSEETYYKKLRELYGVEDALSTSTWVFNRSHRNRDSIQSFDYSKVDLFSKDKDKEYDEKKLPKIDFEKRDKAMKAIEDRWEKEPDGARGCIRVWWITGGAHILNYEKVNGKTYLIDAQNNEMYELEKMMKRTTRIEVERWDDVPDYQLNADVLDGHVRGITQANNKNKHEKIDVTDSMKKLESALKKLKGAKV